MTSLFVYTGTSTVEVTITDVNNKPPRFENDQDSTSVSEDADVGTSVFNYTATDPDETALLL